MSSPSPVRAPQHVLSLLDRLHALSTSQEPDVNNALASVSDLRRSDPTASVLKINELMLDKFVALDKEKCEFVYSLLLATGAKNVVEAGTSFGVSTIYLALAVGENSSEGKVIATEKESVKAARAREHWNEAGKLVTDHVELREGDLLETLKEGLPEIDALLLDIWTPLALPTLKLVQPRMRPGAVVITDNTISVAHLYKDFLEYVRAPNSPFINITLPFPSGLEMSVFRPHS